MNRPRPSGRPLLALFLCGHLLTASAQPHTDTAAPTQPTVETAVEEGEGGELRRYAVRSGGGCIAGAIAGTVVPGLGNAVGCALGALGGWLITWLQEPEDFLQEDP